MEYVIVEKTFVNKGQTELKWVLVDVAGQRLGRICTQIAHTLMGKDKPNYAPGVTMGDGVVVIKAQTSRSQDANRADALARLQELVDSVATPPRVRRATKPTFGSRQRRLEGKSIRAQVKASRGKIGHD